MYYPLEGHEGKKFKDIEGLKLLLESAGIRMFQVANLEEALNQLDERTPGEKMEDKKAQEKEEAKKKKPSKSKDRQKESDKKDQEKLGQKQKESKKQ